MGSLRGLWILNLDASPPTTLFSRRFPTVERRAKALLGDGYLPIISDKDWCASIVACYAGRKVNGELSELEHLKC